MIELNTPLNWLSAERMSFMWKKLLGLTMVAAALSVSLSASNAQNRISTGQLMTSLNKSGATAKKVGIDVNAVRRDIEARIQAEGGGNATSAPPVSEVLRKLPNFIVQVQFNLNSDVIRPESCVTIGRIADALHHPLLAGNRFLIVGHTDSTGSRKNNLVLSDKRALAVVQLLTSTFKVPQKRLLPIGFGEEQIFDTKNPKGGVNRRVELINLGPV